MKNKNYEMHEIGTYEEIRDSRALARQIEEIDRQYPGVVPRSIMEAYYKLCSTYCRQMEREYED